MMHESSKHTHEQIEEARGTAQRNEHEINVTNEELKRNQEEDMKTRGEIDQFDHQLNDNRNQLEEQMREKDRKIEENERQLEDARREIDEKDAKINENQQRIEQTQNEMNELRHQNMETHNQLNDIRNQVNEIKAQPHTDHHHPEPHHDDHHDDHHHDDHHHDDHHHEENDECDFGNMTPESRCDFQFDFQVEGLTHHSDDGKFEFINADLKIEGFTGQQSSADFAKLHMNHGSIRIAPSTLDSSTLDIENIHAVELKLDLEPINLKEQSRLILDDIHATHSEIDLDGVDLTASTYVVGKLHLVKSTLELEPVTVQHGHVDIEGVTLKCSTMDVASLRVERGDLKIGHLNIADSEVNIGDLEIKDGHTYISSLTAYAAKVFIDDTKHMLSHSGNVHVEAIEVYGATFRGWFTENGLEAECELQLNDGFCRVGSDVLAGSNVPQYQTSCQAPPAPVAPKECDEGDMEAFKASFEGHPEVQAACKLLFEDETCECLDAMFANTTFLSGIPECSVEGFESVYKMYENHREKCVSGEKFHD